MDIVNNAVESGRDQFYCGFYPADPTSDPVKWCLHNPFRPPFWKVYQSISDTSAPSVSEKSKASPWLLERNEVNGRLDSCVYPYRETLETELHKK
jgi:hypothetical protein